MKASMAWQDFRHSNLVSTSTPQVRNEDGDDSDGAEEDGFVGAHSNGPQEVMMEIMDKYVLAGEALAEKENDVRQLQKEVEATKAISSDLQTRVEHLTTANEKLSDDEGRWYSLARELENQMDVIKKGETYSLFQDKVDEAEARLEVAADANHTCRKRLLEVYGEVNAHLKVNDNDGGDGDVDEHRQHSMVLEELRDLKAIAKESQDALAASRDAYSSAESAKEERAQEAELRRRLEAQVSQLQKESVARDEAAQARQDALREASVTHSQELRQALEAATAAEAMAQAAEDARQVAVVAASTAEANLAGVLKDLALAHEETQGVEGHLAEARGALETAQKEMRHKDEARALAESRMQELSGRVFELETDLADSSQKIADLADVAQVCRGELAEATARSAELQAHAHVEERRCTESFEKVAELSDTLQALRSELAEKDDAVNRTQSEAEKALQEAAAVAERVEVLQHELEKVTLAASTAEREHAAHSERMHEELKRITADAASAERHASRVEELCHEMESTKQMAAAAAEENASRTDDLRQKLEAANAAATSAAQKNEVLRQELTEANAMAALAEQEKAAHVEGLRQDLGSLNAALVAAHDNASTSQQELERATYSLADAENEMAAMNEARIAAEANAERAEMVRGDAETQLEVLRQKLSLADASAGTVKTDVAHGDSTSNVADHEAAAATQALQEAREDVFRAETMLTTANQAHEELRRHAAKLADEVRGLEAHLSEAKASSTRLEGICQEERAALQKSDVKVNQLEKRLAALQAKFDEKTTALRRAEEESAVMTASGSAANGVGKGLSADGDACADVLFGSPAPDTNANLFDDAGKERIATANGVAPALKSAEAEELQAHAEAMELELRYTLESFEGQLSAMAREKVAIQKQVKELSGQCTTLRKQVSHYKKVAKESETHMEQMLELQQQLCDAEQSAEKGRDENSALRSTNRDLQAKLEVLQADSENETRERMWRQSQDEVAELRARLVHAGENLAEKSQELAVKAQEEASVRGLATALEHRLQEAESDLSVLKDVSRSTAEQLSSALTSASELQCALSKVSELESVVGDLEGEKLRLEEITAAVKGQLEQVTTKLEELQGAIRSFEEEGAKMSRTVQEAQEGRAVLVMEMGRIATLVGSAFTDAEDAETSRPSILEAITSLKEKMAAAEELLGATSQALLRTNIEGEVEADSESRWIVDGVSSLQRRLQVAELELSQRANMQGGNAKVLADLSAVLECDGNRMAEKVRELKKLAHDLSELRGKHLDEIRELKHDRTSEYLTSTSRSSTTRQDRPEDDLPAASRQAVVVQVQYSPRLNWQAREASNVKAHPVVFSFSPSTVKNNGGPMSSLSEGELVDAVNYGSATVHSEDVKAETTNGSGVKHPCVHDKRWSSHRKSSSLQLGASSTWLSELESQGHDVKLNGVGQPWDRTAPRGVTSHARNDSEGGGDANGILLFSRGNDAAFATSDGPTASKATVLLAEIQTLLGCTKDEVIGVLKEQQAASQRENLTIQILGNLQQTYLKDIEVFASALGDEAKNKVSPLLVQASELCFVDVDPIANREGLDALHEATGILTSFISELAAANTEMAEAALRQAQQDLATVNETLRKERLMMMAFRRWGHFYLALSNEALRKRTKEQNQARSQGDAPENGPLSIMQGPRTERGRSRRSSSTGRRNCGRGRLQLSSSEVQVMVEQEAESVARELAAEPSVSLIALADARKEMDDIAMKAQATLGVLYTESPPTHNANVATDEPIVLGMVEKLADGKVIEKIQEVLPSPVQPTSTRLDISHNDVNVAVSAEAALASSEATLAPPTVPAMPADHLQRNAGGVSNRTELPEDGAEPRSGAEEAIPPPPTQSSSVSPRLAPPPTDLSNEVNGSKTSEGTGTGDGSGGGIVLTVNAPADRRPGPLVEDGISKKERAEFLRRQREERKANRKRGMQASASRAKSAESSGNLGVRNRRTSAPAIMPSTADVMPGLVGPHNSATPLRKAQTPGESDSARTSTMGVEDDGVVDRSRVPPLAPSTGASQTTTEHQHDGVGAGLSTQADSPPAGEAVALSAGTVRAPPPRMFNPTAIPPPIAPPSVTPSSHAQQSRHPSMAFNVNETVEKALTEARRDAGVAKRKAAFWRCRFRDLAVWAASFVVLAYASDHGFDDC